MRSRRPSSRSTSLRTSGGQLQRFELLAQLADLVGAVFAVAELLLDCLELLAQEHLALPLAQLLLDLRLDVGLRVDHGDLTLRRG